MLSIRCIKYVLTNNCALVSSTETHLAYKTASGMMFLQGTKDHTPATEFQDFTIVHRRSHTHTYTRFLEGDIQSLFQETISDNLVTISALAVLGSGHRELKFLVPKHNEISETDSFKRKHLNHE